MANSRSHLLGHNKWENFYFLISLTLVIGMVTPLPLPKIEIESKSLQVPSLDEFAPLFQAKLGEYFESVNVSVVECPDLTKPPANLAGKGIGGTRRVVAQQGGVPNLFPYPIIPMPTFSLVRFAQIAGFKKEAHVFGAGQGPVAITGEFSESVPNLYYYRDKELNKTTVIHGTRLITMAKKPNYTTEYDNTGVQSVLSDLYITEGKPGKVLKITARKRINEEGKNLIVAMRKILSQQNTTNTIAMGGIFWTKSGNIQIHTVLKEFGERKDTPDKVKQWQYFHEGGPVMICLSTFYSNDPQNWDVRLDHTHCYSENGKGGHFWQDTTPDRIEYEGYFNFATHAYRAGQPRVGKPEGSAKLDKALN